MRTRWLHPRRSHPPNASPVAQAQDAVALIDHAIDVIERFAYTVNDTNDMSGLEHLKLRTHGSVAEVSPYPFITAAGCANDPFMSKYALENGGPSDKSDGSGSSDLNLTRGSVRAPVPATSTPGAAGSTSNAQSDWRARPAFPTAGARSGHVLCTSRKSNLPQAQGGAGAARDRGAEGGGLSRFTTQRVLMEGLKDNAIVEPLLVFGFPLPFMVCKDDVDHEVGQSAAQGGCAEPSHLARRPAAPPIHRSSATTTAMTIGPARCVQDTAPGCSLCPFLLVARHYWQVVLTTCPVLTACPYACI